MKRFTVLALLAVVLSLGTAALAAPAMPDNCVCTQTTGSNLEPVDLLR